MMQDQISKNYLHAIWRAPIMLIWILLMPALFFITRFIGYSGYKSLPHYFHHGVRIILGLRVTFSGEQITQQPCLYASNHISYLDVFVLGGIRAYFIAKSEVASWPILGSLARFQNTLFFERATGRAQHQLKVMQSHLMEGNSLILFPEGTSTDGTYVEPFKSSLFEAAKLSEASPRVAIQAITVAYTEQDGVKMNQQMRDYYAWYATMPFGSHFRSLFTLKRVEVKVHFHPVCYLDQFKTRKQCAQHCEKLVATTLSELIA